MNSNRDPSIDGSSSGTIYSFKPYSRNSRKSRYFHVHSRLVSDGSSKQAKEMQLSNLEDLLRIHDEYSNQAAAVRHNTRNKR